MVKTDNAAAATKSDIENLWVRIDKRFEQIDIRFALIDQRFNDVDRQFKEIDKRFTHVDQQCKDIRLFFEISVENMYHDFRGAFDSRTTQHKEEVLGLTKRVGAIERRLRYSRQ